MKENESLQICDIYGEYSQDLPVNSTIIILPDDINEDKIVIYGATGQSEILKNEIDVLRVMREAQSIRLQNQHKKIPKFGESNEKT